MSDQTCFGRPSIVRMVLASVCLFISVSACGDGDQAWRKQQDAAWQRYQELRLKTRMPAQLFPHAVQVRLLVFNVDLTDTPANARFTRDGEALTATEVSSLRRAVFFAPEPPADIGCCIPRHAFVFMDAQHHELGRLEVCFECGCAFIKDEKPPKPELTDVDWDGAILGKIIRAHGFPVEFGFDPKTQKETPKP